MERHLQFILRMGPADFIAFIALLAVAFFWPESSKNRANVFRDLTICLAASLFAIYVYLGSVGQPYGKGFSVIVLTVVIFGLLGVFKGANILLKKARRRRPPHRHRHRNFPTQPPWKPPTLRPN